MQRRTSRLFRGFTFLVLTLIISLGSIAPSTAQDGNLLRDGGFEGSFTGRGRPDLNIPAEWSLWFTESPRAEFWQNLPPVAFPHRGPDPAPHGGVLAFNFNKGFATYTAAIYQQVAVTEGANLTASAWAFLRVCDIPENSDRCTSSPEFGASVRIGIDPNGGTNPYDSDVVWTNGTPHEQWQELTVSTTATGSTVTVFLMSSQEWPGDINNAYFDDASLVATGGGSTGETTSQTAPTQPASVNVVAQQNQNDDGSITHVVAAGETMDSIAFAYGVTRQQIMDLNGIGDPRIIMVGQELIIRGSNQPEQPDDREDGAVENVENTEVTGEEDATPDEEVTPTNTPTPLPPAPVVMVGTAQPAVMPSNSASICVQVFDDVNNNRIQEAGEALLADAQIELSLAGNTVNTYTTNGTDEPFCFDELSAGTYLVSAVVADDYGLTTPAHFTVRLTTGANITVNFGAAEGFQVALAPTPDAELTQEVVDETPTQTAPPSNPIADNSGLIVFGVAGIVLVGGMGLSLLMRRR